MAESLGNPVWRAMSTEDRFRPKLGRIRSRGDAQAKRYLNRVLHAVARIEPRRFSLSRKSAFTGTRIGRGAGFGHVAAYRGMPHGLRVRRAIVKTHIAKLAGSGTDAARLHIRYIQRDGVSKEGEAGRLYNATSDDVDGDAFRERGQDDRHQFRIIVSPEDAVELDDLKPFTRRLMRQVERDLDTRLDWVAVDHHDTEHPHIHIVVRGKDESGKDLVIARDYIAHGMRARAVEILTEELGPRSEREIEQAMRNEVSQERFTYLDHELVRDADDGLFDTRHEPRDPFGRFKHALKLRRLQQLGRMGLARESAKGFWRLSPQLEETLRRMGERGDIIKTIQRRMREAGLERPDTDLEIYDPADRRARRLVGRVMAIGLYDELRNRHYVILDGTDGRTHYVRIGEVVDPSDFAKGAIVEISPKKAEPRQADRTIATIAEANNGHYSVDVHERADPRSTDAYRQAHVRRLEALRRADIVARRPDGTWLVAEDYLERAAAFEARVNARSPVRLAMLSYLPLERLIDADGATWLDQKLVHGEDGGTSMAGFGREVRRALDDRRAFLIKEGLAQAKTGQVTYRQDMLNALRQRELGGAAATLSTELGKTFTPLVPGARIEGVYCHAVKLTSGKFAVIETSREFALVPWRDALERRRGQQVTGIARAAGISWSLTRNRTLGV
jgi:type IV secretory pathway VirD2 relaxase